LFVDVDKIASRVSAKCVSTVEVSEDGRLAVHFVDGSALLVERRQGWLAIDFRSEVGSRECAAGVWPTSRQREYLEFIRKYLLRFRVSPAESDIQRHFLVSAPSVNQLVQTLERHGFITRQQGLARSIRLIDVNGCEVCGGSHHLKRSSAVDRTRR
jgi:repressor LexA